MKNLFGSPNTETEEEPIPNTYTEGTIQIPEKAIEIIQHVPKIELGIGEISEYGTENGIASITAIGVYGTFDELEELMRQLEIPFIRTAWREMIQHEIHVYIPEHDGKPASDTIMPCDENGKAFLTLDALAMMLKAFGPQGLANKIREYDPRRTLDLNAWNEKIDVQAAIEKLENVYVSVKAFRDAKLTYPWASKERCEAFANCMAHLTDPTFMIGLGFNGPSAREWYVYKHAESQGITMGQMSYEDARKYLISRNGPIFGELNKEMIDTIIESKSSNDCPSDIRQANAINKKLH